MIQQPLKKKSQWPNIILMVLGIFIGTEQAALADPGTIMLIVGGIAAIAGATTAVVGGVQANNTAKYNANIAQQNAEAERAAAQEAANRKRVDVQRLQGSQIARLANSGTDFSGTALDIIGDTAKQSEFDILNIMHSGEVKATNYQNQSTGLLQEGKNAQTQGIMQGTTTLLNGAFNTAQGYGDYKNAKDANDILKKKQSNV